MKKTPLVPMGSANDSEMGIDHDPSSEIKSNVTVNEKEQVERLFDSSSDEDGGGITATVVSVLLSTSDEEDSGDVSDAAEDPLLLLAGLKKKRNTRINHLSEQKRC